MVKKDNKKTIIYAWLFSLAINVIILIAVLTYTQMMYETNDDFGISAKIAAGYPYIGFVNYFLCKALIIAQGFLPQFNIFVLSQLVFSFISFTIILKVVFSRSKHIAIDVLGSAVVLIYALDHYCSVQFTKTAGLLMAAGLLWLIDNYIHEKRIISYILGYALFYIGVMYRQQGMFVVLAFTALFLVLYLILNRYTGPDKQPLKFRELAMLVVFMLLALVPYGLDMISDKYNAGTEVLKYARDYQAERVRITDYPVYEHYEDYKDEYDAIGLDENDIYLVTHWMLDYDGAASLENLKTINKINADTFTPHRSLEKAAHKFISKTRKDLEKYSFKGVHIIILIMISLCMLLLTRPKNWLYIIAIGTLTVGVYIAVYYLQRVQYRAFYIADISATAWLLYALALQAEPSRKAVAWIAGLLCTVMIVSMTNMKLPTLAKQAQALESKIESEEAVNFYKDNQDKFYVCATSAKKRHPSYLTPTKPAIVEKNATGLGGWGTLSPYELDQIKEFGLNNLVGDIIDNDKVFFLGTTNRGKIEQYLNKWYGDDTTYICFEQVDSLESLPVYRVVRIAL